MRWGKSVEEVLGEVTSRGAAKESTEDQRLGQAFPSLASADLS
jgi:hypothetical protein